MRVCRKSRRWKSAFVREYPRAISSSIRISVAPSPVELDGSSFSRSAKAGLSRGQRAQILTEQIKTGLWRGRPVRLPDSARRREFPFSDIDGGRPPLGKPIKPNHLGMNKTQLQPGHG